MLQYVAVCRQRARQERCTAAQRCSTRCALQYVAVRNSVLQCVAVRCSVLRKREIRALGRRRTPPWLVRYIVLQFVAVRCSVLQKRETRALGCRRTPRRRKALIPRLLLRILPEKLETSLLHVSFDRHRSLLQVFFGFGGRSGFVERHPGQDGAAERVNQCRYTSQLQHTPTRHTHVHTCRCRCRSQQRYTLDI